MSFQLPQLPYSYDALEPVIDAATLQVHHQGHHKTYVEKLNKALEKSPDLRDRSLEEMLSDLNSVPAELRTAVRNNGGGHYNHSLFWIVMRPAGGEGPRWDIGRAIDEKWGNFSNFRQEFSELANGQFGSGYAWLVVNADKRLEAYSTANQDSPLSDGKIPVLLIDVWEHAYYLKYRNGRAEYVQNWWNVVNWEQAQDNYQRALRESRSPVKV